MILAARGARNLDNGEEKVNDSTEADRLRRTARRIHIKTILAAALLTLFGLYF